MPKTREILSVWFKALFSLWVQWEWGPPSLLQPWRWPRLGSLIGTLAWELGIVNSHPNPVILRKSWTKNYPSWGICLHIFFFLNNGAKVGDL